MDIFETATMLPAVKTEYGATSFLRDRYFANVHTSEDQKIIIDVVNGKRRVAPFVHPKIGGKVIENDGYATNEYEAPEVSPMMVTTAENLLYRLPGEQIMGAKSPEERAIEKLGEDLSEMDKAITRREDLMCSEALFNGQVTVKGEGYDEVIRYWSTNPAERPYLELTGGAKWDQDTADPWDDIEAATTDIIQKSGVTPTEVLMGANAWKAFRANLQKRKVELDFASVHLGEINPRNLGEGVQYKGYLVEAGLNIFTYNEWVLDEEGKEVALVPEDKILIGSPSVPTTMAYGLVSLTKDSQIVFYAERRVPDSWAQPKPAVGRVVQVKSRPLPILNQVAGWKVLKVL